MLSNCICMVPILLVLFSHLKSPKPIQPIEYFVVAVSILLFIHYQKPTEKSKPGPKPLQSPALAQMQELKLNEIVPIIPKSRTISADSIPKIHLSPSKIDSNLRIPSTSLSFSAKPRPAPSIPYIVPTSSAIKTLSIPISAKVSPIKLPDSNLTSFHKEFLLKHRDEIISSNQKIIQEDLHDEGLIEFDKGMEKFSFSISSLFLNIRKSEEESKRQQMIDEAKAAAEARDKAQAEARAKAMRRMVIEPYEESYQRMIVQMCEIFGKRLEESRRSLGKDLSMNIKGIVSQITSDKNDQTHLESRVKAMLGLLGSLDKDTLNLAIYVLCEAVVSRGLDQADSIDLGSKFSFNYTKFILFIAKSYKEVHKIYFIAIVSKKYLFYPLIRESNLNEIKDRSELKDYGLNDRLNDSDKLKLTRSLDLCRAYGFLIGNLLASKDSYFNEGDIWRYLIYILNLNFDYIDRSYLTFLQGFIKTTHKRLMACYGKQYVNVFGYLNGNYVDVLNVKFGNNPYLKAYITQLRDLLTKIKGKYKIN